ncbi:MAG TPA: M14 family metallopeptidase [Stellaceae bacterium]|nr:M14 family metallopeptidase [Stellaceae bacterium]
MGPSQYFSASYAEARQKFRDAATTAGARVFAESNERAKGPAGEALATDLAWLGPADAKRVLVTVSATHGAEGFCGSGVQTGTFLSGAASELSHGTALLAVHAINPYGFAWVRRVTEDNVDLNRNFITFRSPLPRNEGYALLADAICPAEWTPAGLAAAKARLDAFGASHGAAALQRAITSGQYSHADGVFYGGEAPVWSHRMILAVAKRHLAHVERVAVIDYHTGLGPYGHGERIVTHAPASAGFGRAQQWYGDNITSTSLGTSRSSEISGDLLQGLEDALPHAEVTTMALEYGVRPLDETIDAVRADNWLHTRGRLDSAQGRDIKAMIRATFYGDADDWKDMIFEQAIEAQRRALRGLAG